MSDLVENSRKHFVVSWLLYFYLIEATNASYFLYQKSDIDTKQWTNVEDVLDMYYEKCTNGMKAIAFVSSMC